MNVFESVKKKWLEEGLVLLPSENSDSVISCFKKLGATPTEDVIQLYSVLGGMEDMDGNHFRMWSLDEIIKENRDSDNPNLLNNGVMFADYLVNCWCYLVAPLSEKKKSSVLIDYYGSGDKLELRGKTLSGFYELLLEEPDEVLY